MPTKRKRSRLLSFLPELVAGCKHFSRSTNVTQNITKYQENLICVDKLRHLDRFRSLTECIDLLGNCGISDELLIHFILINIQSWEVA